MRFGFSCCFLAVCLYYVWRGGEIFDSARNVPAAGKNILLESLDVQEFPLYGPAMESLAQHVPILAASCQNNRNCSLISDYLKKFGFVPNHDSIQHCDRNCNWLTKFHGLMQTHEENRNGFLEKQEILIVGAGPIGLCTAIHMFSLGYERITLIEKRGSYTRNMYFDIGPSTWFSSYNLLQSWGLDDSFTNAVKHKGFGGFTIQAKSLESFLAKLALLLGIRVIYHAKFVDLKEFDHSYKALVATNYSHDKFFNNDSMDMPPSASNGTPESLVAFPFTILVGADGAHSIVRSTLGLPVARFQHPMLKPVIKQPTIIVKFKSSNGTCPAEKTEENSHEVVKPWDITFHERKIVQGFKRFFNGYCELQLILKSNIDLAENNEVSALIFNATQNVLQYPPENTEVLSSLMESTPKSINIAIMWSPEIGKTMNPHQVGFLVGDALTLPYYRLGIGINAAYTFGLQELSNFTSKFLRKDNLEKSFSMYKDLVRERIAKMCSFQTLIIYLESYCDFLVFFDPEIPNIWDSILIYRKDYAKKDYTDEISLHEALSECQNFVEIC